MQLEGGRREVLITRPAGEAAATGERVRAFGFLPVLVPLLRVEGRTVRGPAGVFATLVTSGNALGSLAGLEGVPLFAVGDSTAERALKAGFERVESAGGDASALLALVRGRCPVGACLLLASGAGQGVELARELRRAGFRVHRRVGYAAWAVRRMPAAGVEALTGGGVRAVLFLSGETARVFVRVLPPWLAPALAGVEALAIGQAAADHLTPLPWGRVRVSFKPTLDQVLALL